MQQVLKLLFDEAQLKRTLDNMEIDGSRLGGVASVITPAFSVLSEIERVLASGGVGADADRDRSAQLSTLSKK